MAQRQFEEAVTTLSNAIQTLAEWKDQAVETSVFSKKDTARNAVSVQRAKGGRSKVHKIDADPELRAFIEASILSMTYDQIVAEVAANFSMDRRVTRSSVARWWSKQTASGSPASPETG
ncbi:MAG: hypothetical protein AAF727_07225 [Pseudomonadota bacterium]